MAVPQQSAVRNRLLAALAPEEFGRLAPALELVPLAPHDVLIAPQQPITQAFFVEDGIVSLVADTREARIEIGLTGREGFVGVPLALGAETTPHTAIVQAGGEALRIVAGALEDALDASAGLRRVLGRYVQSLIVQVGQTVYANADLTVEARLARWILMTHDRLEQDELPLTHETLSKMLGVRRPTVTMATHTLEGAGMIRARRGRITVVDRVKLEGLAGAIYGAV
ncbi:MULTISPECIES: Crp/Fnr family transcriptional regulator [unclassified Methylobacterium]|jgi:CRP-like cAMP-binding protein|uniref:Crp/Fnr family transcriptional regulator n=1 Tax=unclassified Methylobacterium TaxID=2615210 RepID=UPI00135525FB|nr:Crp/Fnr family transcriptional regulator [Methylobacterium sp. 2A]MWV22996.1 Crp/Fnr family transcriptional regulator [Methylobacterium sp. 2A]